MLFRTPVSLPSFPFHLSHEQAVLSIGSCFATHLSQRLREGGFSVYENPFGILYNPLSISESLKSICQLRIFTASDLFYHQEEWHSYSHHGDFSAMNADICLEQMNNRIRLGYDFVKRADVCLLTLGSAFVYEHISEKRIMGNCHRLPSSCFQKRLLCPDEIVQELQQTLELLHRERPNLNVIFSVSPVRHSRDGLHENNLSKSVLLLAVEALCRRYAHVHYFPAYEIVLDELRDYRFFASDMLHPSEVAVEYVWELFRKTFFQAETQSRIDAENALGRMKAHRLRNPNSEASLAHLQKISEMEKQLHHQFTTV